MAQIDSLNCFTDIGNDCMLPDFEYNMCSVNQKATEQSAHFSVHFFINPLLPEFFFRHWPGYRLR